MDSKRYNITGGDHGNYTIFPLGETSASAVAWLRRNLKGGGYTLRHRDGRTLQVSAMLKHGTWQERADELMKNFDG